MFSPLTRLTPCFALLAGLTAGARTARAQDAPVPVKVKIAGRELRSRFSPVVIGGETFVPLEAVVAIGGKFRVGGDRADITLASGQMAALPVRLVGEAPMVALSELARFAGGVVERPEFQGRPGDTVFLLARVLSVDVDRGVPEVLTAFPVARINALTRTAPVQGTLELRGARLTPESKLPLEAFRGAQVRVLQRRVDEVVILIEPDRTPAERSAAPAPRSAITLPPNPLTAAEVLRVVDANYPKLIGLDFERLAAEAKLDNKRGTFDPNVRFFTESNSYNSSGKLASGITNQSGFEIQDRSGIKYGVNTSLNAGSLKDPLSVTGTGGAYSPFVYLPLLQNLGINPKAVEERQAALGIPLTNADVRAQRLEILQKAAVQYWEWVAAARRLAVRQRILDIALEREKQFRDEVSSGIRPGIDLIQAQRTVASREADLAKSRREQEKEGIKLGVLLWTARGNPDAYPDVERLPDEKTFGLPQRFDEERAIQGRDEALKRRPELDVVRAQRQIYEWDRRLALNRMLPDIGVYVNPGFDTGLAGLGQTMKFSIGLNIPLGVRSARAQRDEASAKIEKVNQEERLLRRTIVTQVDDAYSAINRAYDQFVAALREADLAEAAAQGERDRLLLGEGDVVRVNLVEEQAVSAQVKVINLQSEYEQAVATFRAVSGQL